jgi:hypothetical protein
MSLTKHYSDIGGLLQSLEQTLAATASAEQYLEATKCVSDFEAVLGMVLIDISCINKMAIYVNSQEVDPQLHHYLAELNMLFSEVGRTLAEIQLRRQGYLERS